MKRYFDRQQQQRIEMEKYYHTPVNRRLKYCALGAISVSIVLLLIVAFCMDSISYNAMMIMRGCAGLSAIIFAILFTLLMYRVNRSYIRHRKATKRDR